MQIRRQSGSVPAICAQWVASRHALSSFLSEAESLERHLADHLESTCVGEWGMLVSVHPAGILENWGFGDFQSLRTSPGGHPIQPI